MDVSVIILNYKTPKLCCDCIDSLNEKSSGFTYEIIVIDNASNDDSKEILTKRFGDKIRFIKNEENLGTARAFNQGANLAKGDYLFFLNTDILFINNAIYEQLSFLKSHQNVAIVGGNLYNSAKGATHSYMKSFFDLKKHRFDASMFGIIFNSVFKKLLSNEFNYTKKPKKVDFVCAAATLMRKDVYKEVGGFDEEIFIYGDEALYAYECLKHGYLSYNVPSSQIIHFEGDSFKKDDNNFSEARVRRYYNGLTIHMKKIHGFSGLMKYYRCKKILLKNKAFLFSLMRKKGKASNAKKEIAIIDEYIEKAVKTNAL